MTLRHAGPLSEEPAIGLSAAREGGAWEALDQALGRPPAELCERIQEAGLRGRGGGEAVGPRWGRLRRARASAERVVVGNGQESEPGSFRDRWLLEHTPQRVLEGLLLAAHAIEARWCFLVLRPEYRRAEQRLGAALAEAREAGLLRDAAGGERDVVLVRGSGSPVCGEEGALLEALSGRPGLPRAGRSSVRAGAFGLPSLVHNVETLCHLPAIVRRGSDWFRAQGAPEHPGTTLFGVSGHVARPGLYELPFSTPLDELVFQHAGGVPEGRKLRGVLPAGLASAVRPAGQLGLPMSEAAPAGRGGVIVMDERTCMVDLARRIADFHARGSCGQCLPCRSGTSFLLRLLQRLERGAGAPGDLAVLGDVAAKMEGQGLCGFVDEAREPLLSLLRAFRDDFEQHAIGGSCGRDRVFEA